MAYPGKTTEYSYDAAYNRLTERSLDHASQALLDDKSYHYNNRNQLTVITDNKDNAHSVSYTFDANGNQTLKSKNGVITTFLYDVRDQLVSVQENATTLGMFYYDYQGMRVAKDMGGQIVRYSYDGKSVLTQSDVNGQTIAKYEYGPDQLLSMQHVAEGRQFYLFDALGSVSNLTNTSGMVQARYQYDAFGNLRAEAGSSFNRFTFTGHEKDTETGLYYFKARFYDPDTGRFLNQDPYLGDVNTPPSLHRYLYAYANPVVWVDPTGHVPVIEGTADELANLRKQIIDTSSGLEQNGANVFTSAAMGLGAGLVSVLEGATRTVNLAGNLAIDTFADDNSDSYFVQESRRNLSETKQFAKQTYTTVVEDPIGVGTTIVNSTVDVAKGFVAGDNASVAKAFSTVFEAATGGVAAKVSGPGIKKGLEATADATKRLVDDVRNAVKGKGEVPDTSTGMSDLARARSELRLLDTSDYTNAQKGALGEARASLVYQRAGYTELEARLPSNNGFDGVFVKYDADGVTPIDIIINESKFTSTGRASLSNTNMGRQMSPEWIDANIQKMRFSDNPAVVDTARLLKNNSELIRVKANVLNEQGLNRWNVLKLPE